jgi:hypothetical protein
MVFHIYPGQEMSMSVITGWGICVVDIAPHFSDSTKASVSMDIVHLATIKQMVLLQRTQRHACSNSKWSLVAWSVSSKPCEQIYAR